MTAAHGQRSYKLHLAGTLTGKEVRRMQLPNLIMFQRQLLMRSIVHLLCSTYSEPHKLMLKTKWKETLVEDQRMHVTDTSPVHALHLVKDVC